MKLLLVTEGARQVWVAALVGEHLYCFVANTGRFHDNNALRNDYYLDREFEYAEIDATRARQLIRDGVGHLDEETRRAALAEWRADPQPLNPEDVFAAATATT